MIYGPKSNIWVCPQLSLTRISSVDLEMPVEVFKMSEDHIPHVARLYANAFAQSPSALFGIGWLQTQYRLLLPNPDFLGCVAVADGQVVGYVCGGVHWHRIAEQLGRARRSWLISHPYAIGRYLAYLIRTLLRRWLVDRQEVNEELTDVGIKVAESAARLWVIVVADVYRGRGVADNLMRTFIGQVKQRGSSCVWLTVDISNGRAQRFYERHGWECGGRSGDALKYVKHIRRGNNAIAVLL